MIPRLESRTPCADKNDSIGWPYGTARKVHTRTLGLRSDCPELLSEMEVLAGPYGRPMELETVHGLFSLKAGGQGRRRGQKKFYLLYDGWTQVARSLDRAEVLQAFRARWLSAVATIVFPETNVTKEALVLGNAADAHAWVGLTDTQTANLLQRASQDGVGIVSRTALVFNLSGTVRAFPDEAADHEEITDLDALPATRLRSLSFVDDQTAASSLSPGQGALRLLGQVIGNTTLRGEMVALANALAKTQCRTVPSGDLAQMPIVPESALAN